MNRMVRKLLCAALAFSLLFSACGGQEQEKNSSSQASISSKPSSTSSSSTQETSSSDSTEPSSSQSSNAEVTDDFNPKKKKIGYELFLNRPEELLYLEDISEAYRQTLGQVEVKDFWIAYDSEKELFGLHTRDYEETQCRDFLFQPDGTVIDTFHYPSGTRPNPMPSWMKTIEWNDDLDLLFQYDKEGNANLLSLPEIKLINPDSQLSISSDEKWISYISNNKLYLYDLEKRQLAWSMTPKELGIEEDYDLLYTESHGNNWLMVCSISRHSDDTITRYLDLLTGQTFQAFYEDTYNRNIIGPVDGTHYLWLPFSNSFQPALLMEQRGNQLETVKELDIIAQDAVTSENGKWILFIDRNLKEQKVVLTLCDTATFTSRWSTTLQFYSASSLDMQFSVHNISDSSCRILFTALEKMGDDNYQFFTLTPPAEALS